MKKLAFIIILIYSTISLQAQQWEKCSSWLNDSSSVQCFAKSENIIIGGTQKDGILITTDNGNNWNKINNGLSYDIQGILSLAVSGDNFLAGTNDGLYISIDSGKIWNHFNTNGLSDVYTTEGAIIVSNNSCFYGINGAIFASTNSGSNWKLSASGFHYSELSCFGFKNDIVFACTNKGLINISKDWGNTWDSLTTLPVSFSTLDTFDSALVASTGKGLYMSNDDGISWSQVKNNLQNIMINSIVYTHNFIFAGTNKGVFYSAKYDDNWKELNEGFEDKKNIISLIANDDYLFASNANYGVYKLDILAVGVEELTTATSNIDIFPNPAGDFITIKLGGINPTIKRGVDETSEIAIYNTLGERVMTVEQTPSSVQQINISALPRGMYFVKIDAGVGRFLKM